MKKVFIASVLLSLLGCDKVQDKIAGFTEKKSQEKATEVTHAPTAKTVAWLTLEESNSGGYRLLSGQVSAAETTHLSFETSGKIQAINVKLGDQFKKGQRLALLDTTNYQLQLRQAKAAYGTAVANRDQAQKEVRRFERLVRAKAASAIQLDGYRLQYRTAQEAINNTQAQIELAEKQLKDTSLLAPFNGVVTAQLGEVGQLASPKVPIFTVEASGVPEVSLSVPENMIAMIQPQQKVSVTLPAQEHTAPIAATVSEIATQASYGAFPVTLVLHNAPQSVKPGMTAEVAFSLPQSSDGFHIPPGALGAGVDNSHFVYRIVNKSEHLWVLEKVSVTVDTLVGESITVHGQLQAGDKIVRSGWSFLKPDQTVSLMGEGAQTVNP